jgi:hypothetical protein
LQPGRGKYLCLEIKFSPCHLLTWLGFNICYYVLFSFLTYTGWDYFETLLEWLWKTPQRENKNIVLKDHGPHLIISWLSFSLPP